MVVSVFKLWTFNRITKNPNQGFFLGGGAGAGAGAGWAGTGVLGRRGVGGEVRVIILILPVYTLL